MCSKTSISSIFYQVLPSFSTGSRSFFSQFVMISAFFVLLIAFLPHVSSSPTPSSNPNESNNNNNKVIYDSNAFMLDSMDQQSKSRGDSFAPSSSSVPERQFSAPSSAIWFGQPKAHANQFLMSHVNDNEVIVPKSFTRLNNNDDDDDDDDYIPLVKSINKRSPYYSMGGYSNLKKRKQMAKPPMEVMNEIVNSIYL